MKYVNQYDKEEKSELAAFMYNCIGKNLVPETVDMRGWIRTISIHKSNLSKFLELMKKYEIKSYKVLKREEYNAIKRDEYDGELGSNEVVVKFLEQYPKEDKEEESKFDALNDELRDLRTQTKYSWKGITYRDVSEFDDVIVGNHYAYFIMDKEHEEDVKNIVNHAIGVEVVIYYVDIKSTKYDIDGLIWFKIPDFYNIQTNDFPSYKILCLLLDSHINHCIYIDRDGRFDFDVRMRERLKEDNRNSDVGFRKDLKIVFKSSWEANLARVLKFLGVKWEYEKDSFLVKSKNFTQYYFPDFFLDDNTIIELKGIWDTDSIKKVSLFKEQYKNDKLITIDTEMYYTLDKIYSDLIPEWEHHKVTPSNKEKIPVVGIARPERMSFVKKVNIGDELFLKRDPNNSFDSNAILVVNAIGDIIGFMAKDWASIYADKLDVGMKYRCVVKEKETKVIMLDVERMNWQEDCLYEFLKKVEVK